MTHRIFASKFSGVCPHSVTKAEKKNRTKDEVDQIIRWLDRLVNELSKGKAMEKILRK